MYCNNFWKQKQTGLTFVGVTLDLNKSAVPEKVCDYPFTGKHAVIVADQTTCKP